MDFRDECKLPKEGTPYLGASTPQLTFEEVLSFFFDGKLITTEIWRKTNFSNYIVKNVEAHYRPKCNLLWREKHKINKLKVRNFCKWKVSFYWIQFGRILIVIFIFKEEITIKRKGNNFAEKGHIFLKENLHLMFIICILLR